MSDRVPTTLGKAGREFWLSVTKSFVLNAGETALLRAACKTLDEIVLLEAEMAGTAATVPGSRGQPVASPLYSEVRRHRAALRDLINAMALPSPDETVGRRIKSPRSSSAAQARWRNTRRLRARSGGDDGDVS